MTVTELLIWAKQAIESGETSLHAAAEDIAAAQEQGANQRQIAKAVGKLTLVDYSSLRNYAQSLPVKTTHTPLFDEPAHVRPRSRPRVR